MKNFTQVPNVVLMDNRLTPNAFRLFVYLLSTRGLEGYKYRKTKILNDLGMSRTTYHNARLLLLELGYLVDNETDKRETTYYIPDGVLEGWSQKDAKGGTKTVPKGGPKIVPLTNTPSSNTLNNTRDIRDEEVMKGRVEDYGLAKGHSF